MTLPFLSYAQQAALLHLCWPFVLISGSLARPPLCTPGCPYAPLLPLCACLSVCYTSFVPPLPLFAFHEILYLALEFLWHA